MNIRFVDVLKVNAYWRVSTWLFWGALLVGVPIVLSLMGSVLFMVVGVVRVFIRGIS